MKLILNDEEKIFVKSYLLTMIAMVGNELDDVIKSFWISVVVLALTLVLCYQLSRWFYQNKTKS
jgi:hypothetical protein